MFLDWLLARELESQSGHFCPLALFPSEGDAFFYLNSIRPVHPEWNYIIRQVDSEKDIYEVCNGQKD